MNTGAKWSPQEISYAQMILNNGGFPSDVAQRVRRKFKTARTAEAVRLMVHKGKLRGKDALDIAARDKRIADLRKDGWTYRQIGGAFGVGERKAKAICESILGATKPKEAPPRFAQVDAETARLLADDPIADIGVGLIDLRANSCRYPIARWPEEYSQQRFCGAQRDTENGKFVSSYCPRHRVLCRREKPMREAAE